MDIYPAFASAQSAAPPIDRMYEPSAIDNFDTMSHPAWEQCWTAGGNSQHEDEIEDFVLKYEYTSNSTNLTDFVFSQEYPTPPHTAELASPKKSPSNSDDPRHFSSTQSGKQKRKPNHTKRAPAKSSRRGSSKHVIAKAAAEVYGDTEKRDCVDEAAAVNRSSPHLNNNMYTRKVQERNRMASNKFRARKKEDEKELKSAEKDMVQINRDLTNCATNLTLQVYNLKMKLLEHTDCDCTLIQEYIAHEAHRYIQDLGDKKQCQQP
ncbi:hypothetical protein HZS61_011432 [Fusarium oxysporum f. sp. conglutinans]|uniref:BZIP domain-containing protein n=3 Tax=Fusarium oxysporum f. sp. conglutinans TaxID=100902 RepID=A0A8H6GXR7_FUSOX|nr:hypothetical protein FOXB_02936 [Fusarium oxysporum f. sp. conglutinans Fo5176]KAF6525637.1 hypothetical protein HZS61_011432 [Fusarium oxysporum f. sp. conglutinans]KAI8411165.1 hypothetical protein FOFC_07759 [Fusarium oxysporum]